jgi:hypothetical protein
MAIKTNSRTPKSHTITAKVPAKLSSAGADPVLYYLMHMYNNGVFYMEKAVETQKETKGLSQQLDQRYRDEKLTGL